MGEPGEEAIGEIGVVGRTIGGLIGGALTYGFAAVVIHLLTSGVAFVKSFVTPDMSGEFVFLDWVTMLMAALGAGMGAGMPFKASRDVSRSLILTGVCASATVWVGFTVRNKLLLWAASVVYRGATTSRSHFQIYVSPPGSDTALVISIVVAVVTALVIVKAAASQIVTKPPSQEPQEVTPLKATGVTTKPGVRTCPTCQAEYRPADYNPTATAWLCSSCKQALPRG